MLSHQPSSSLYLWKHLWSMGLKMNRILNFKGHASWTQCLAPVHRYLKDKLNVSYTAGLSGQNNQESHPYISPPPRRQQRGMLGLQWLGKRIQDLLFGFLHGILAPLSALRKVAYPQQTPAMHLGAVLTCSGHSPFTSQGIWKQTHFVIWLYRTDSQVLLPNLAHYFLFLLWGSWRLPSTHTHVSQICLVWERMCIWLDG